MSEAQAKQLAELQAALAAKEQEVQEAARILRLLMSRRDSVKSPGGPSIESGSQGNLRKGTGKKVILYDHREGALVLAGGAEKHRPRSSL